MVEYDKPEAWVRRIALNRAPNARRRSGREQRALSRLRVLRTELVTPTSPTNGCGGSSGNCPTSSAERYLAESGDGHDA